jgi:hypothetical protein
LRKFVGQLEDQATIATADIKDSGRFLSVGESHRGRVLNRVLLGVVYDLVAVVPDFVEIRVEIGIVNRPVYVRRVLGAVEGKMRG